VADTDPKQEEQTTLTGCVHAECSVLYRSHTQSRGRGPGEHRGGDGSWLACCMTCGVGRAVAEAVGSGRDDRLVAGHARCAKRCRCYSVRPMAGHCGVVKTQRLGEGIDDVWKGEPVEVAFVRT
jgi:hypothetical protein